MSMDANTFEIEKHADDDLHCIECGKKIRYCHGDTDLCSDCRKGSWTDPDREQEGDYDD
jgi:hypothetical protein